MSNRYHSGSWEIISCEPAKREVLIEKLTNLVDDGWVRVETTNKELVELSKKENIIASIEIEDDFGKCIIELVGSSVIEEPIKEVELLFCNDCGLPQTSGICTCGCDIFHS